MSKKSIETQKAEDVLKSLGNPERIKLLTHSCLTLREQKILYYRYIEGMSVKEAADKLNLMELTYIRNQQRALNRLYQWLIRKNIFDQIYSLLFNNFELST